jgi:hypothetical protein
MEIYYTGVIIAVSTFLIIGLFHPIVIKVEYHTGTRYWWVFLVAVIYSLRESVRTPDDKYESPGSSLLALYPFGKLDASELQSVLIHQHHGIGRLNQFQNQFTLPFLLLLFAETLGVLELRNRCYIEGHIVGDALGIILDARNEMLVYGLADQYQFSFHLLNGKL